MNVITTTSDLAAACIRLAAHPYVTVDTEFMRETTFWPKLCLIQMAGPDDELIVDPLAPGLDLRPFYALMADERKLVALGMDLAANAPEMPDDVRVDLPQVYPGRVQHSSQA